MNFSPLLFSSSTLPRYLINPAYPLISLTNELSFFSPSGSTVKKMSPSPRFHNVVYIHQKRTISTYRLYSQVSELQSRITGRVPKGVRLVTNDIMAITKKLDNWSMYDIKTLLTFIYAVKYRITNTIDKKTTNSPSSVSSLSSQTTEAVAVSSLPLKSLSSLSTQTSTSTSSTHSVSPNFFPNSSTLLPNFTLPEGTYPYTNISKLEHLRTLLTWSHASYSRDKNEIYQNLQILNETVTNPGRSSSRIEILHTALNADVDALLPAFIVGIDHSSQSIIISIRGTWTWQDALINFSALPEPCSNSFINQRYLEHNPLINPDQLDSIFTAHRGMVLTAKNLINNLETTINFISQLSLQQYPQYQINIVGHSLGGGIAAIMAILLQPHIPNIQAYSFSSPACMSAPLAKECQNFVTSIVNGDDVVSRFHVSGSELLREELQAINWKKEFTERIGIDRIWSRISSVIPTIEHHISTVSNTISSASSTAMGTSKFVWNKTMEKITKVSKSDIIVEKKKEEDTLGRIYSLEDRLRRHKHQILLPLSTKPKLLPLLSNINNQAGIHQDTAKILSQAESISSTTINTIFNGVKTTILQSMNIIKPVLKINDNVSIPIEMNQTGNSKTNTTNTVVNPNNNNNVQEPVIPNDATTTTISLNKAMQYYIPGDIYWMYYPSNYSRILEENNKLRRQTIKKETIERQKRTTKLIHNMEDFHVDIDDDIPPSSAVENESNEWSNTSLDDNDIDDIDNDYTNPLISHVAMDDMGMQHQQMMKNIASDEINKSYHGGILLRIPYREEAIPNNKSTSSMFSPLKELPHALFAKITMSKWMFMDHTATSLELEWDHYVQYLKYQEMNQTISNTTTNNNTLSNEKLVSSSSSPTTTNNPIRSYHSISTTKQPSPSFHSY